VQNTSIELASGMAILESVNKKGRTVIQSVEIRDIAPGQIQKVIFRYPTELGKRRITHTVTLEDGNSDVDSAVLKTGKRR
jgi:hypothetical protein